MGLAENTMSDAPERDYGGNQVISTQAPSNVKVPLSQQEKLTDELHMVLGDLTNRLESVLTPQPPTDEAKAAIGLAQPDDGPKSATTYRVEENNRLLRSAIVKIRNLVERVES